MASSAVATVPLEFGPALQNDVRRVEVSVLVRVAASRIADDLASFTPAQENFSRSLEYHTKKQSTS